jgi:hypothetical protein
LKLMVTALDLRHLLDGFLAGHGAPPLFSMPVGRLCDFTRWYLTREADEKERGAFERDLFRPPPGTAPEDAQGPWAPEAETAALAQFGAIPG